MKCRYINSYLYYKKSTIYNYNIFLYAFKFRIVTQFVKISNNTNLILWLIIHKTFLFYMYYIVLKI